MYQLQNLRLILICKMAAKFTDMKLFGEFGMQRERSSQKNILVHSERECVGE